MSQEKCENFSNCISSNLNKNNTPLSTDTNELLEKTWHKIQISIQSATHQHIPFKKYSSRNLHNIYSSQATQLHLDLKQLGHIICQVKNLLDNNSLLTSNILISIDRINSRHDLNIIHPSFQLDLISD